MAKLLLIITTLLLALQGFEAESVSDFAFFKNIIGQLENSLKFGIYRLEDIIKKNSAMVKNEIAPTINLVDAHARGVNATMPGCIMNNHFRVQLAKTLSLLIKLNITISDFCKEYLNNISSIMELSTKELRDSVSEILNEASELNPTDKTMEKCISKSGMNYTIIVQGCVMDLDRCTHEHANTRTTASAKLQSTWEMDFKQVFTLYFHSWHGCLDFKSKDCKKFGECVNEQAKTKAPHVKINGILDEFMDSADSEAYKKCMMDRIEKFKNDLKPFRKNLLKSIKKIQRKK